MTETEVQEQLAAIKKVRLEVLKSKEACRQMLIDIRVIKPDAPNKVRSKKSKNK